MSVQFPGVGNAQQPGAANKAPLLLDKGLLEDAQAAVLDLMRRPANPLVLDVDPADPRAAQADQEFRTAVAQVVGRRHPELSPQARLTLIDQLLNEMRGYGPLEPLLRARDRYEEIEVNRFDQVYVVPVGGEAELTPIRFRDDSHVRFVAARLLSTVRRRVTDAEPMVDASLAGMRINVIASPVAVDGTSMTIRLHHRFKGAQDLVTSGTLTPDALRTLMALVAGGANIMVTGGTGTGKTTTLNAVSNYIPGRARIVTVEDAVELDIRPGNVVRLETRPPNIEGKGEITIRSLVRNALRMRPDCIVVGEMRGSEALDFLTAGNSGHQVFSTLHANSAAAALYKLTTLAKMSEEHLSEVAIAHQVATAVHAVVHMERQGPQRRVVQISEVAGVEPLTQQVLIQDVFALRDGHLVPTGVRPERWIAALAQRGIAAPATWFGEVASCAD